MMSATTIREADMTMATLISVLGITGAVLKQIAGMAAGASLLSLSLRGVLMLFFAV